MSELERFVSSLAAQRVSHEREQASRRVAVHPQQLEPCKAAARVVQEFVFHSIFACPVSKDQSTRDNPPMLLPCGHVLCRVPPRRPPTRHPSAPLHPLSLCSGEQRSPACTVLHGDNAAWPHAKQDTAATPFPHPSSSRSSGCSQDCSLQVFIPFHQAGRHVQADSQ